MSELWIEENYKEGLNFRLKGLKKLFSGQSDFQKVEIFESTHHGRVLLNDGCFMLSERDERIYHEMMAHVPLFAHPEARQVLIIGGGDGGTAREVLRHENVERCVLVEIDKMVVDACREFIPVTARAFDHPKLELKIDDGVRFMRDSNDQFDVILIDSTDPSGAAVPLFGPEFYSDVAKRLKAGGVVVAQGESVFYEQETQKRLFETAAQHFKILSPFNFTNMTYPGGLWSFLWASNDCHPLKNLQAQASLTPMFYYSEAIHRAAFQPPQFQREALAKWITI
jgi:spermidine synthase